MEHALIVLIALVVGGGVTGGMIIAWGLRLRVWRTEKDVADLQVKYLSDTRKRAADGRWSKADIQAELAKHQAAVLPVKQKEWWEEYVGR